MCCANKSVKDPAELGPLTVLLFKLPSPVQGTSSWLTGQDRNVKVTQSARPKYLGT